MLLAKLMTNNQTLIYASTSAVYEGQTNAPEDISINEKYLDPYSLSMIKREQAIKSLSNVNTIGIRFGTVVGITPKLRSDRVHIQMIKSALFGGKIYVKNSLSYDQF